jgi:hypothetical protein
VRIEQRAQMIRQEVPTQCVEPSVHDPGISFGVKGPEVLMGVDLHQGIVRTGGRLRLVDCCT